MTSDHASASAPNSPLPLPSFPPRIEYFRSYRYVLESPNWIVNILWGALAYLSTNAVPIIGPLIYTGYLVECLETLHTSGGTRHTDFDANRLSQYLTRGIWPFLVDLLMTFAIGALAVAAYIGMIVIVVLAEAAGEQWMPVVLGVGLSLGFLSGVVVLLALGVVLTPLYLRAALSQDLGQTLRLGWCADFLKRTWLELVLVALFMNVTGLMMMAAGCLLVCVGMYGAIAWIMMAGTHLSYQLYELYLARGGEPIPLKPPKPVPPPYRHPGYGLPGHPPVSYPVPLQE